MNIQIESAPGNEIHEIGDFARAVPQRVAVEQQALTELRKLTPPARLAKDWQLVLGYRQSFIAGLTRLQESAASGDTEAVKAELLASAGTVRQLGSTARRAGFHECGKVG